MPANAPSIPLCVMPRNANTVIAARIGVDEATVRRTRKKSTSANAMLKKRTGKDGKARKKEAPARGTRRGPKGLVAFSGPTARAQLRHATRLAATNQMKPLLAGRNRAYAVSRARNRETV